MTAREIIMPDASPVKSGTAGKLKAAKLRDIRQQRSFQDVLEKSAAEPQRATGETRRNALQTTLESVPASRASAAKLQPKAMAADELRIMANLQQQRWAESESDETDVADKPAETEDERGSDKSDAGMGSVRLEQVIAGLLPAQQPATALRSAGSARDAPIERAADPADEEEMLPPSRLTASPAKLPQSAKPDRDETVKMRGSPTVEPEPPSAPRLKEARSASAVTARTEPDPLPVNASKAETVTVTRLETTLLPSGNGMGQLTVRTEVTQPAAPLAATVSTSPAPPAQAVVKTIEFRLQPEELGPVKVALHMRGEELRVQVEVTTREGHALLQRDKSILSSVLEKAGYEVAEAALTITLRPDSQLAPSQTAGNDSSAFQRNSSNSSETFQNSAGGEQSRHAARQPEREDHHGSKSASQAKEAGRPAGAGGIYL